MTFWWAPNGGHVFTPEQVTNKIPWTGLLGRSWGLVLLIKWPLVQGSVAFLFNKILELYHPKTLGPWWSNLRSNYGPWIGGWLQPPSTSFSSCPTDRWGGTILLKIMDNLWTTGVFEHVRIRQMTKNLLSYYRYIPSHHGPPHMAFLKENTCGKTWSSAVRCYQGGRSVYLWKKISRAESRVRP